MISLNIGLRDRQTFAQSSPDDFVCFEGLENHINALLGPDRIIVVTVGWRASSKVETTVPTAVQVPEREEVVDQSCLYCGRALGTELWSNAANRFVHQDCVEERLETHPDDIGAKRLAAELGVSFQM